MTAVWEGLNPPYATLVVDPPWHYEMVNPPNPWMNVSEKTRRNAYKGGTLGYSSMTLDEIRALPVADLADDARLFLWTTNRYLRHAWSVMEGWGFVPQDRTLVWCKTPRGTMQITTEFVLVGKRGNPARMPWTNTTWYGWPLQIGRGHSSKPPQFFDLVESLSPGPYVELFARAPRLGWDHWGYGYESAKSGRGGAS